MSTSLGNNINGPSLIRVPAWVPQPLGRYYLYFAHHEGRSIRLAFADDLTGPWRIFEPGALTIEQSLFPHDAAQITPIARTNDDIAGMGITEHIPHIASPDVLVDDTNQQILMYFHGMVEDGDQKTRLAQSKDGLAFTPQPALFDHYYFRVFRYLGWFWVISWGGHLYRAKTAGGPFERGPDLFQCEPICLDERILRHLAVLLDGDVLHLFFSRIGDQPETILHTEVQLAPDWTNWRIGQVSEILRPTLKWEGANLPVTRSKAGAAHEAEHGLRDPCVFQDADGQTYLLYCGSGEQAIGVTALNR